MENIAVKMENIYKVYDNGIIANDDAFIEIKEGEIHALAGENGAGKSTLMKILYGLEQPTSGKIFIRNNEVKITSPTVAASLGIGMVHQHFMLVEQLNVAENIFLGIEKNRFGIIDKKASIELVNKLALDFGMQVNPGDVVANLSLVQKQKVEILKVLARNARIIILDEPTAVLTPQETVEFFQQLRLLKKNGYTIIIITHKLNEIKQICDRITIMRNGHYISNHNVNDVSEEDISRLMIGRDAIRKVNKPKFTPGNIILKVQNINKYITKEKKALSDVSFEAHEGEILCLCGVEGNGQRELVKIITGFDRNYDGDILLDNISLKKKSINKIRLLGENHIPEDRIQLGVDKESSIADSLISIYLNEMCKNIFIDNKKISDFVNRNIKDYQIKCDNGNQKVKMLSGGNMQKVVVARETCETPKLLIADQPTRGVDIGAIEFIHQKLIELRSKKTAILLISSDLSEVFSLSDRIIVFHNGKIVANINDVEHLTEEELGLYMLGLKSMEANDE